jgi:hypothetical protein
VWLWTSDSSTFEELILIFCCPNAFHVLIGGLEFIEPAATASWLVVPWRLWHLSKFFSDLMVDTSQIHHASGKLTSIFCPNEGNM